MTKLESLAQYLLDAYVGVRVAMGDSPKIATLVAPADARRMHYVRLRRGWRGLRLRAYRVRRRSEGVKLPVARVVARVAARWPQRLRSWLRAKLHRCNDCRVLSTDEGIGGRCMECGRIYGWMTRDELRRLT